MSKPLKIVSVMIALLLLVEPAFANPIMVSPFQVTNPALAAQTLCKPKIALGAFCAPGAVSYDANSNLLSKRTRGACVINYAYDNLNRLTTKTYPDTTSVAYSYDNASRLTSVTGPASANSYSYDNLNRVTQTTAAGKTISYEYDSLGNRTKLTYPDASFITYQYDFLNRLTGVLDQGGAAIAGHGYDFSRSENF